MKNIKEYIEENNIKLLGEIETQEENFEYLKNQLITRIPKDGEVNLDISLEFVRFAIKHYDDRFWPSIYEVLGIQRVDTTKWGKLFLNTIKRNKLLTIPQLPSEDNQYVENIKFHAIVPDSKMGVYCEFLFDCYQNFFKDSIDDRTEFKESLKKLSDNIKSQLNNNKEEISSGESNKSYTLLKASRRVFAEVEVDKLTEIFYPIFRLIDDFYEEKDIIQKTRLQKAIYKYLNKLDNPQHNEEQKRDFQKTPYIKINYAAECSTLCFPKGSVLSEYIKDEDKKLIFNITFGKKQSKPREESIKRYFDNYIYDNFENFILNTDIFEEIRIEIRTVRGETIKEYIIPKSNYRIFTEDNKLCKSMHKGKNYLITKKGVQIKSTHAQITSDTQYYNNWDYHIIDNFNQDSILKIGYENGEYDTLCLNSIFNQAPQFDSLFTGIKVKKGEIDIPTARKHPTISFSIKQYLFNNAYITINNDKKFLTEIEDIIKTEIDDLYLIKIPLENILNGQYGFFNIRLITNEQSSKSLIEYVVFPKNFFHFEQDLYVGEKEAKLYIKGLHILNNKHKIEKENSIISIPLTQDEATFNFISNGKKLSINIPIPIFKYGTSKNNLKRKTENDFLWYKDNLYFYIGKHLFTVSIEDKNTGNDWKEIDSEIDSNYYHNINLNEEKNNKTIKISTLSVRHPTILIDRKDKLEIFPQKLSIQKDNKNDKQYIKVDKIIGKEYAKLVVDIKNHDTGELICEKYELKEGINEIPISLDNSNYDLYPFMREGNDISIDTPLEGLQTQNITLLDIDSTWNLNRILGNDNGIIQVLSKIEDTQIQIIKKEGPQEYTAKLSYQYTEYLNNEQKEYDVKIKVINKRINALDVLIQIKTNNDEMWIYPYIEKHHLTNQGKPENQLQELDLAVLELPNKENK